jgi:hypothetical protein
MPIPAIMALLSALAPLAVSGFTFWTSAKEHLAQTEEYTPELEAALDAKIEEFNPMNPNLAERDKQQPL